MTKAFKGVLVFVFLVCGFIAIDVWGHDNHDLTNEWDQDQVQALLGGPSPSSLATNEPNRHTISVPVTTPLPASQVMTAPTLVALTVFGETPTPFPTPTAGVVVSGTETRPTDSPHANDELGTFDTLITPFQNEAIKRRAEMLKSDPQYLKRVDAKLNEGRVNFLLFGYGETHEPPATEKAIIGSQTIISYDVRSRRIDIISLTHDIRAPEIERELAKRGTKTPAVRIDQAYTVGGFKLMRETIEDATGLSIDFQMTFKDVIMQDLVDTVFDGVLVDVPTAFDVHPFYLEGKKYDAGHFAKGVQRLNGRQVIQFIKTVPVTEGAYDKSLEHNVRKALVFDSLLATINKDARDRGFWIRGGAFVTRQLLTGSISYDFDPVSLFVSNVGPTTANLQKTMAKSKPEAALLPRIRQSKYVVDPAAGDGGVQWVTANAAVNPNSQRDIDNGVYPSLDVEVPYESNAYGDLITEYWPSVRSLVRTTLTTN